MHSVDKQYIELANKVYYLLEEVGVPIAPFARKIVAIAIASYIEDKQSNLCLFSSYVEMYRRESDAQHPFDALFGDVVPIERIQPYIDVYDEDSINAIDIAFLLAQNSVEFADEADTHFEYAKALLVLLQDEHYEQLPSNDEYFDDLYDLLELNGWEGLKVFLLWFSQNSYFQAPITAPLAVEMYSKEVESIYAMSCKNPVRACQLHQLFDKNLQNVGFRPVTFAEEFARRAELDDTLLRNLREVEVVDSFIYEIQSVSATTLNLLSLTGEEYTVAIDKSDHTHYVPQTCATGKLVYYASTWHFLVPPGILHRTLTPDERESFLKGVKKAGKEYFGHR